MRYFFLILVIILFVGGPARAEEPTAESKRLDVLRQASATQKEIDLIKNPTLDKFKAR